MGKMSTLKTPELNANKHVEAILNRGEFLFKEKI